LTERRQILTLVGITLIIGVAAVSLMGTLPSSAGGGEAVVEEYSATFYPDGRLEEEYTYTISERRFRFLFRVWEAPLTSEPSDFPYIEPLMIVPAPGAVGYFKDNRGFVHVDEAHSDDRSVINAIDSLALENEVGSFNPSYYDPGSYVVRYLFDVHPPLEYDDDTGHLNLMLASEHIPYRRVVLTFEEAGYIERLYVHPPTFTVSEEGDRIVVEGRSGEDELIEVEMLIDLDALEALGIREGRAHRGGDAHRSRRPGYAGGLPPTGGKRQNQDDQRQQGDEPSIFSSFSSGLRDSGLRPPHAGAAVRGLPHLRPGERVHSAQVPELRAQRG